MRDGVLDGGADLAERGVEGGLGIIELAAGRRPDGTIRMPSTPV